MQNKLGEITYGDYCVEFYVHFKGKRILVRATSETTFEFPVEEFADDEDELLEEFCDWLDDNIIVKLSVNETKDEQDKDKEIETLRARVKALEEECNWLEHNSRRVQ